MKSVLKLSAIIVLVIVMVACTTNINVKAAETESNNTRDIDITGHENSSFKVGIPTSVVLVNNIESGCAQGNYNIIAQGYLDPRQKLIVTPTDELLDTDGININILQAGNTSNKLQVDITDPKTEFSNSDIATETTIPCELKTLSLISSGSWSGMLNYTISLHGPDTNTNSSVTGALKFSSDEDFTLKVDSKGWDGIIEYSTDDMNNWSEWSGTQLSGTKDQPIYLRGTGNTVITASFYGKFNFTGKYIDGNIENLLDYQTVSEGEHPTMGYGCYAAIFYDCDSLTQAPELTATTLAPYCYTYMFGDCNSLTQASELPATTLADGCYASMFYNCDSLTQAPELPAMTLVENCYNEMFSGCTSLTQASELPATTLADGCYACMFYNCGSLTQASELPATTLETRCYESMFENCTSLVKAPKILATVAGFESCERMFAYCTSLTEPPELIATTLDYDCYTEMFEGCTGIRLSETKTGNYTKAYRIPKDGTATTPDVVSTPYGRMFKNTGGTFTGDPDVNTTYYLWVD